jgi:hypothetical protein
MRKSSLEYGRDLSCPDVQIPNLICQMKGEMADQVLDESSNTHGLWLELLFLNAAWVKEI